MDTFNQLIPTLIPFVTTQTDTAGKQLVVHGSIIGEPGEEAGVYDVNCMLHRRDAVGIYVNIGTSGEPDWKDITVEPTP